MNALNAILSTIFWYVLRIVFLFLFFVRSIVRSISILAHNPGVRLPLIQAILLFYCKWWTCAALIEFNGAIARGAKTETPQINSVDRRQPAIAFSMCVCVRVRLDVWIWILFVARRIVSRSIENHSNVQLNQLNVRVFTPISMAFSVNATTVCHPIKTNLSRRSSLLCTFQTRALSARQCAIRFDIYTLCRRNSAHRSAHHFKPERHRVFCQYLSIEMNERNRERGTNANELSI